MINYETSIQRKLASKFVDYNPVFPPDAAKMREYAIVWANSGQPCIFRHGLAYRGSQARYMSREEAVDKISQTSWQFGKGFYELSFCYPSFEDRANGMKDEMVLEFNELGENDLF